MNFQTEKLSSSISEKKKKSTYTLFTRDLHKTEHKKVEKKVGQE